jgi:hypothetical protein
MHDIEVATRDNLARVLASEAAAEDLDLDADLVDEYGLTSLNKVLFLTATCDDAGVDLSNLTEDDVSRMQTLRDVIETLARHDRTAA